MIRRRSFSPSLWLVVRRRRAIGFKVCPLGVDDGGVLGVCVFFLCFMFAVGMPEVLTTCPNVTP